MPRRDPLIWTPFVFLAACGGVAAGREHVHSVHHHAPPPEGGRRAHADKTGTPIAVGFGGGWMSFGTPFYMTIGPDGQPVLVVPPWLAFNPPAPVPLVDPGALGGPMPAAAPQVAAPVPAKPRRVDPGKGAQFVTIGDRLFRAKNFQKAGERYEQAVRANPSAAPPRVRLSQVALVRGRFADAAAFLREAVAAEPGWLAKAPDIQSIYAEPSDFARQIARLESRVLVEPGDRDAWLVLGAELYFSGQTRRASDVFLRLTDRKPDATLAAFLDAASVPGNADKP